MALRWYILPLETIGHARGPMYLKWRYSPAGLDVPWGMMDGGLLPTCLVWANVTDAQHSALMGNANMRSIRSNVDDEIGASSAITARLLLEERYIPGNWIARSNTGREVLRSVAGLFQFAQRVHGRFGTSPLPRHCTLDTAWSEIPERAKTILLGSALELGIDTSETKGSITLRQVYKSFGDAWGAKPILINGLSL